jgi:hypothetical protein
MAEQRAYARSEHRGGIESYRRDRVAAPGA